MSISFLFLLLWVGGLEGETVQSELPVDVRDRGKALPAGKEVLLPLPESKSQDLDFFYFLTTANIFTAFINENLIRNPTDLNCGWCKIKKR